MSENEKTDEVKNAATMSADVFPVARMDHADPRIFDTYANDVYIRVGPSDVSLAFGIIHDSDEGSKIKPSVRVHMTHDIFVRFVSLLDSRRDSINAWYGGDVPTLADTPAETISEETKKWYGEE